MNEFIELRTKNEIKKCLNYNDYDLITGEKINRIKNLNKLIELSDKNCYVIKGINKWINQLIKNGLRIGDENFVLPTRKPITIDDINKLRINIPPFPPPYTLPEVLPELFNKMLNLIPNEEYRQEQRIFIENAYECLKNVDYICSDYMFYDHMFLSIFGPNYYNNREFIEIMNTIGEADNVSNILNYEINNSLDRDSGIKKKVKKRSKKKSSKKRSKKNQVKKRIK
jgi:hypothetical protein